MAFILNFRPRFQKNHINSTPLGIFYTYASSTPFQSVSCGCLFHWTATAATAATAAATAAAAGI